MVFVLAAYAVGLFLLRYSVQRLVPARYQALAMLAATGAVVLLSFVGWGGAYLNPFATQPVIGSIVLAITCVIVLSGVVSTIWTANIAPLRAITRTVMLRIPFVTALSEEILFRSVLLYVLLKVSSMPVAILASAVLFGLWHVYEPANRHLPGHQKALKSAVDVLATCLAGGVFAWLTLISGSIYASWLLHWLANSTGTLVVHRRRQKLANNGAA